MFGNDHQALAAGDAGLYMAVVARLMITTWFIDGVIQHIMAESLCCRCRFLFKDTGGYCRSFLLH